jgi:hypothetical protein
MVETVRRQVIAASVDLQKQKVVVKCQTMLRCVQYYLLYANIVAIMAIESGHLRPLGAHGPASTGMHKFYYAWTVSNLPGMTSCPSAL